MYKKFLKFKNNQQLMSNRKNIPCPFPDCEEIVEIKIGTLASIASIAEQFVQCSKQHKFCTKCKNLEWHEGKKCNNVFFSLNQV